MKVINFSDIILMEELSTRGGGVVISLSELGYENERMTAYQNYLGGGMLGKICSDCTIGNWIEDKRLVEISIQLKAYLHSQTNDEDAEWESQTYEQNQNMPSSAY